MGLPNRVYNTVWVMPDRAIQVCTAAIKFGLCRIIDGADIAGQIHQLRCALSEGWDSTETI